MKQVNHIEGLVTQSKKSLAKARAELAAMKEQLKAKHGEVKTLEKGLKAFQTAETRADGRVAPTLEHVQTGFRLVFQEKPRMSKRELEQRTIQLLSSQEHLTTQGLALRVKQALAKLKSDTDGFVSASSVGSDEI